MGARGEFVRQVDTAGSAESGPSSNAWRVLLLNATHEPLAVVTGRRALVLILAGKAESVEDRIAGAVRSERLVLQIPAVVRLNRYVRVPYRPPTSVTRAGILRRDGRICGYCGAKGDTIDHVIPRSRGGKHSWDNCVACCSRCNTRKADRLLEELGWKLSVKPGPPRRASGGQFWLVDGSDPAWARWLDDAA
ncbi:HNH endonuclease [Nakamurella silvestris]|nr:HNH endonuclease [Nakamurella silvestris]